MSSRNKASKRTRHDSSQGSGKVSTISKRAEAHSTPSPSSHKSRTHTSSLTKHNATRPASSHPSHTSYTSTSTSNTSQSSTIENDISAYAHTDLISMSAWTEDRENAYQYQEFSYNQSDSTETSNCLYHSSLVEPRPNHGYGMPPLERWVDENIDDGGPLALRFGYQLNLQECTCVGVQAGIFDGTMYGD